MAIPLLKSLNGNDSKGLLLKLPSQPSHIYILLEWARTR